jgi:hypothetical protein
MFCNGIPEGECAVLEEKVEVFEVSEIIDLYTATELFREFLYLVKSI